MNYYIYIIQSAKSNKFYVGYSTDPCRRVIEHNTKPFNTFTSKYRPWNLVAVFLVGPTERDAIRLERFIKKNKSISLIRKLTDSSFMPTGALAQLVRVPHVRD
ncbi:MAG: GIY-YIG nuclease family protein [Bacteroidetes bacterium]|nr:MAG: GIY-YIG nuclease family protein [Bacteroidota bacterium]